MSSWLAAAAWLLMLLCSSVEGFDYRNDSVHHRSLGSQRGSPFRVFLDHTEVRWHSEVFYSVAGLVMRLFPYRATIFLVDQKFATRSGMKNFWNKYAKSGPLRNFQFEFVDTKGKYQSYFAPYTVEKAACRNNDVLKEIVQYDMRVIVSLVGNAKHCLERFKDDMNYLFIVHHPEYPVGGREFLEWSNVYVATDSPIVHAWSPRHFSPALFPIHPAQPVCTTGRPIFIAQGDILKRNTQPIDWLLNHKPKFSLTLRLLTTRTNLPAAWRNDSRVQILKLSDTTRYHEAFLGGAFILPLISPEDKNTAHYFEGHPTSSIAYGVHFRLRFIGHARIQEAYATELAHTAGYWHREDTMTSFVRQVSFAVQDFTKWCTADALYRKAWSEP